MEKAYQPTEKQREVMELSSVIENAPYLLADGRNLGYIGMGKSSTCNCSSSQSSGGTCRALSLEDSASE